MKKLIITRPIASLSLLVVLLSFIACAVNPVTGKKELSFMSEEQEIALGKESDPQIVQMYGLYENQTLQNFIDQKGQEMAKISHRPHLDYEFKILDSPVVNAFAVPGGFVYFTRGILAHFNNEAEFAGVLGHEIGHVTARHSVQQQTKATIGQVVFIGGLILSPTLRTMAQEGQQFMQLLFLKYSRDNESQSDELGVQYSTAVGYDAHHMANFFKTLNNMRAGTEGETLPTFLSTHPDPADRYQKVNAMADAIQRDIDATKLQVNRDQYLRMIDGLIYGEDPKQGYVENGRFYHPTMRFQFPIPQGWQTINTPSQVQMAPKDGKAAMILTLTEAANLQAAAQQTAEQYSLTVVEQKNLTLNGMNVLAMVSDQVDQQSGQSIRILSYFISYSNSIFTFHGLTDKESFDKYVSSFNQTMRNFARLTDQSKINKKPDRISVRTVNRAGTLQSILQGYRVPSEKMREHGLINGMDLNAQVPAGSLIKVITQ